MASAAKASSNRPVGRRQLRGTALALRGAAKPASSQMVEGITQRQLEPAEQMAAIEARDFGEVAIQAKVLADMLSIEPQDPERTLAVAIAKRLEALAAQPAGTALPQASH
jgi:hypothetical protein